MLARDILSDRGYLQVSRCVQTGAIQRFTLYENYLKIQPIRILSDQFILHTENKVCVHWKDQIVGETIAIYCINHKEQKIHRVGRL
jgi:hypothetical protein